MGIHLTKCDSKMNQWSSVAGGLNLVGPAEMHLNNDYMHTI